MEGRDKKGKFVTGSTIARELAAKGGAARTEKTKMRGFAANKELARKAGAKKRAKHES